MENTASLLELLQDLEIALKDLRLWGLERPSREALSSTLPFAVDSLSASQWLQFIFIPRMTDMLRTKKILPTNMEVTAYVEEYYCASNINVTPLLEVLRQIDNQFS